MKYIPTKKDLKELGFKRCGNSSAYSLKIERGNITNAEITFFYWSKTFHIKDQSFYPDSVDDIILMKNLLSKYP